MSEIELTQDFEFSSIDGEDFSFVESKVGPSPDESLPHLIFLIPGIWTDGEWAQQLRFEAQTWAGRPILCKPVRGNGRNTDRLNLLHVVTRFGLQAFRENFEAQITHVVTNHDAYTVNIVAHSMGSALFSEIIENVSRKLKKQECRLNKVVFLGSICHRKHSKAIASHCNSFVNDVGRKDHVPFLASIVNPLRYDDVGTRGFLDGFVSLDRFFPHSHKSCTHISHLKNKVIPLIETNVLIELGSHNDTLEEATVPANLYVYLRWLVWFMIVAAIALWVYF